MSSHKSITNSSAGSATLPRIVSQPRLQKQKHQDNLSVSVSVSVSAQDGIVALGNAHTRSIPPLSSLPKVALETVPMFVWLNTDCSQPQRVECRPHPFSTPLSFRRPMLWCSGLSIFRKFLKPLSTSALPSCRPDVISTVLASLSNNNNNNNNNNRIERRNLRFLQSLHCAANCLQHIHSSGLGAIVCKPRVAHQALNTCNMLWATRYEETAQLLILTEFKSCLF